MANIKDLAIRAGVSPSTASIVVNGKSEERKISSETQKRVWDAAKEIGYRPNMSARRLRDQQSEETMSIALYWSSDVRATLMTRFLHGLQQKVLEEQLHCDFLIHPYENDHLQNVASIAELSKYHAVIICNASELDVKFLESMHYPIPIILYNRESEQYPTVSVDDERIGQLAAEVFLQHGRRRALIIGEQTLFPGIKYRVHGFQQALDAQHATYEMIACPLTMKGGYDSLQDASDYDCIFCLSDHPAIGIIRYALEHQLSIPEDIELIAIGNADHELEEYAALPLSVIELPMEDMAKACLSLALQQVQDFSKEPISQRLPVRYIKRHTTK